MGDGLFRIASLPSDPDVYWTFLKSINFDEATVLLDPEFIGERIVDRFRVGCEAIGDGLAGDGVFKR